MSSDDDNKNDLTRIEDLSEFLHSEEEDDFESLEDIVSRSSQEDSSDSDFVADNSDDQDFVNNDEEEDFSFSDMDTSPDMDLDSTGFNDDASDDTFENSSEESEEDPPAFGSFDGPSDSDEGFSDNFSSDFDNQEEDNTFNDNFEESSFDSDESNGDDFSSDFAESSEESTEDDFNSDFDEPSFESNDSESLEEDNSLDFPEDDFSSDSSVDSSADLNDELTEEVSPVSAEPEEDYSPSTELVDQNELAPVEEPETIQEKTPLNPIEPSSVQEEKVHTFEDVKSFASSMSLGNINAEGNPPFSIIINNIKYYEDIDPLISLLIEHSIINEADKEQAEQSLKSGRFLIPRLSEYAAILLAHKLRKFDMEILMGLTEEITPPKSYESNDRGLSYKKSIFLNKKDQYNLSKIKPSEILTSTLPLIEGYNVNQYLGVATKSLKLSSEEFEEESKNIDKYYNELTEEMKKMAIDKGANALVGISFQVIPQGQAQYQILATGNLVWIDKVT